MISLVSTIFNDRNGLQTFFEAMSRQSRLPDEIVVVDAGSKDGTWELMLSEASRTDRPWKMRALQEHRCNVARGRNLAIDAASGEIIVSTDIGCDWDPEWLGELIAPLEADPSVEQVNGSWAVEKESLNSPWALTEWALKGDQRSEASAESHCSSRSIAYRKRVWKALGGYPEDLTLAGDDAVYDYLSLSAGVKRDGAPKIRCYWHRHDSLRAFYKEAFRYGVGDGEAGIRFKDVILIGGRLLMELGGLVLGTLCLFSGVLIVGLFGLLLLFVAVISVLLKITKIHGASEKLKKEGVTHPLLRLLVFTYGSKWNWIQGHIAGRRHGRSHCLGCHRRLKEMNPSLYRWRLSMQTD